MLKNEAGQTLLELVVVIAIIAMVVGALVFATVFSLRNAQFAKNQAQGTKLAQEALEKVRVIRDRNNTISTTIVYPGSNPSRNINLFSELYTVALSHNICNNVSGDNPCSFRLNLGVLTQGTPSDFETIPNTNLRRQILIGDQFSPATYTTQKTVTAIVQWTDASCGEGSFCHESRLTTILGVK